jgi:hypothetical protein
MHCSLSRKHCRPAVRLRDICNVWELSINIVPGVPVAQLKLLRQMLYERVMLTVHWLLLQYRLNRSALVKGDGSIWNELLSDRAFQADR